MANIETLGQRVRAEKLAFLVDGEIYYRAVAEACETARHRIYILGWDIDSRIRLRRGDKDVDETLAEFLSRLISKNPQLHIYILEWDFAMFYSLERETWTRLTLGWMSDKRVHFELDDNHPVGACHHQKIVVIDDQLAFLGGFDLASFRWDTSEHSPNHPKRHENGTSYGPVHDIQAMLAGDAAGTLGDIARDRWYRATGEHLEPPPSSRSLWLKSIKPDLHDVEISLLRTDPDYDGREEVREIENFYLAAIEQAESFIYFENQYLSSQAVGNALADSLGRDPGPEIVLVLPRQCPGWLEEETMGALRQRLLKTLYAADRYHRLLVCYPDRDGLDSEVIIVHSKLMAVDDKLLTLGSANLSNRSMGFDTECNLALTPGSGTGAADAIAELRNRLLAEHLGTDKETVAETVRDTGSLIAVTETCRGANRSLQKFPELAGQALLEDLPADMLIDPERPASAGELLGRFGISHIRRSETSETSLRTRAWRFAAVVSLVALLGLLWHWTPLKQWLNLETLLAATDYLRQHSLAIPIILCAYLVGSCLMFPINLLILVTALSFGSLLGFVLAFTGSILGGMAGYLAGHLLGHEVVSRLAGKNLNRLSRKLARRGWIAVALVRIVPIAPYTIVNMVAGASHISAKSFLIGTAIGLCPGILAIMIFEEGLERVLRDPHWGSAILAVFALIGALLVFFIGKHLLTRQKDRQDD